MRKAVQYKVDIYVEENGVISEAQCECGAGQGPSAHCKHVGAVLYAVHKFATDGSYLFNEVTCTQRLQTFHQPKRQRVCTRVQPLKSLCSTPRSNFDPRPPEYRDAESYQSHFRSCVFNYRGPETNMPVLQLYQPANLYAVYKDHDYLKTSK